ncbi:hypothetical protein ADL01_12150 [Streptomyces sp. NRRL WC-3618]|uniref:hypothetical protein n=1 Tax=Streptomyces sp. NRRL WC-3618 TaxID=1519490 RepID=UPI0006AF5B5E|nr:hypothetical protein [Streptomyces sp. NRRL WC-3618]KOV80453.1 hypothetical protein ADL01_12150 [Streptomyces sp. NRRL WC-3618]
MAPVPHAAPRPGHQPVAVGPLSVGESRHTLHHADPAGARHGADRGRVCLSAAVIRLLERLGRVPDVRRPTAVRRSPLAALVKAEPREKEATPA